MTHDAQSHGFLDAFNITYIVIPFAIHDSDPVTHALPQNSRQMMGLISLEENSVALP
jgi:hypothetical protein